MRWVLGSRSPRRKELLLQLVPEADLTVMPPDSADEAGFDGLTSWPEIAARLKGIVQTKAAQVRRQLSQTQTAWDVLLTADTTVIVAAEATPSAASGVLATPAVIPGWSSRQRSTDSAAVSVAIGDGPRVVIGAPPERSDWAETVREWFLQHYAGQTHWAVTATRLELPDGRAAEALTVTAVTMRADVERWLDWYLGTGESRGKAGGYALQGAGSVFITQVEGSLTNVIGLPLETVLELRGALPV